MQRQRLGFTLLELLLTLAMAVVLMGLVGQAFRFYTLEMADADIENRQIHVATSVLQMLEDDLRSTLHYEPIDTAPLDEMLSVVGAGNTSGQAAGGAAGVGNTDPIAADPLDDLVTAGILQTPGLIGNQYQIQIDVSRLPRLEEYQQLLDVSNTELQDVPSDLKTVTYFVQSPGSGGVTDALSKLTGQEDEANTGGLVRRSLDRAATTEASLTGGLTLLNQTGDLISSEVTAIEFSYWDGYVWQIEWNSDELGELPLAVQVTMELTDPVKLNSENEAVVAQATRTLVHIIRLPMARVIEEEDLSMTESTTATGTAP